MGHRHRAFFTARLENSLQNFVVLGVVLMLKCLLSIDWDYFIYARNESNISHLENKRNLIDLWYKSYILASIEGKDIRKNYRLSPEVKTFWNKIKNTFAFSRDTKAFVSDSHALSYNIVQKFGCNAVILYDAHSDLGYGGLSSLDFEVNCSNWLGKLFADKVINKAVIIYSPYTKEKPRDFEYINAVYDIAYNDFSNFGDDKKVAAIHICRSGAWTPPWFDDIFEKFINDLGIPYKIINCPKRKWNTNISFSDQIKYLLA